MEECGDESTRHSWRREHETQLEEKTLDYGGEERGAKRGREQVENEGREGTNGKMA